MIHKRQVIGIECPRCGHGTYVGKTTNFVRWLLRQRVCKNSRCRHVFETSETIIDPENKPVDLFT